MNDNLNGERNENGNGGIGFRKMKMILSFGEMETNDELKTNELIK